MTYEEFEEEMDAIHEGRATGLTECVFCPGDQLRGIMSMRVAGGSDPTEMYTLNCGHEVM